MCYILRIQQYPVNTTYTNIALTCQLACKVFQRWKNLINSNYGFFRRGQKAPKTRPKGTPKPSIKSHLKLCYLFHNSKVSKGLWYLGNSNYFHVSCFMLAEGQNSNILTKYLIFQLTRTPNNFLKFATLAATAVFESPHNFFKAYLGLFGRKQLPWLASIAGGYEICHTNFTST